MKFISVCSGIEAASVAFNPLGFEAVAFSEIEPFPCAVLAHHYPNTPNWGDMTKFKDWPDASIDLLCGGTPCQSFSVAGLRKGLDDPRGNLMLTFGAIAAKYRPQWLVWENVPGVLSSNGGADFGSFLGMLGELGYGFAYRVLDAQYFGVAQRRRRVFVVACLGDWRSAAAVLFERHSMSGHSAPRREAGKAAPTIPSRSTAGGGLGTDFDCDGGVVQVCPTLRAGGNKTGGDRPPGTDVDTADSLIPCVAPTLDQRAVRSGANSFATSGGLVPVSVALRGREGGATIEMGDDLAFALRASSGGGDKPHVLAFDTTQVTSQANLSNPKPGDPCHPLAAGAHAPAIAFDCKASGQSGFGVGEIASTMRAMGHADSHQNGGGHQAVAYTTKPHNTASNNAGKIFEERSTCLDANSPPPALLTAMQVRRLTPEECEALQGFPRGYTAIPWRKKAAADCPDGPRYKALGNSWAVPNVAWIGQRLQQVEAIRQEQRAAA